MGIGDFARASRLSQKALRLYDASGLLQPVTVDPHSGYRRYSDEQLPRARWIARLRSVDVPLAEIGELLDLAPDEFAARLRSHAAELQRITRARTALIEHLVAGVDGRRSDYMSDTATVVTRDVPARRLWTTSRSLTSDRIGEFARALFARYGAVAHPQGVAGLPFLRYHGEIGPDAECPVEFCCPITEDAGAPDHAEMTVVTAPAGRYAAVDVAKRDAYSLVAFEILSEWAHERNTEWAGPPEQIFLADPETIDDDAPLYQIAIPIA
ncbi:MerR family transcriptional regulator [Tsukamurella sp. 8F]|uniref:MerR family transcriptional regulator n=1 Tax=unclassified Tsukamurella TaxID=2633480 RepID=UPI0023B9CB06|nr:MULTISPECIES: MerR family transcriptional regulator [unclassified Tsukamurella]MDF0529146.1 MerR family transcriptional regulator [Tsukamurella sp. 8J]MDF0585331.1 MerR family transcriptional regulator [Tsukamurella sp. 8F]